MSFLKPFSWRKINSRFVIGLDEVGRGCLAGSVYAAAVAIDLDSRMPRRLLSQVTDSKLLSPKKRNLLALELREVVRSAVAFSSVEEIDCLNIHQASMLAMHRAFEALGFDQADWAQCHLLIDGNKKIKSLPQVAQTAIVKGDRRAFPIGAASILAKVKRDEELVRLSQDYPQYGFEVHKGYGTKRHREALAKFGPSDLHRRTFGPVKKLFENANRPCG